MSFLRALVPSFLHKELRLQQARRRSPLAGHIWSPDVAAGAKLGLRVGVAEDVVINSGVSLGNYSYVNRGAILFSGTIGRFCSIAHYSQIGAEQHPARHISTSPHLYGTNNLSGVDVVVDEFPSPPVIGSDVWIGSAAVVMQGVTVGHGAIIGAGAVVTRNVAPFSIVGGVPAEVIGQRFTADVVDQLLDMAWWDWPVERLTELGPLVSAGTSFTDKLVGKTG